MFEQTFRNLDNVLRQEAGCGTELDYIEQTSWMLFLKYLDDLEHERALEAELLGKAYSPIIRASSSGQYGRRQKMMTAASTMTLP